jgi:hypothetical protein
MTLHKTKVRPREDNAIPLRFSDFNRGVLGVRLS